MAMCIFFFQAEDGIRDGHVTGVQTCALPISRGSMRDALSLLDQAIAYSAGSVTEQAVRAMLGTIDDSFLYSILEGLARGDSAAVLAIAEDIRSRSVGFDGAL